MDTGVRWFAQTGGRGPVSGTRRWSTRDAGRRIRRRPRRAADPAPMPSLPPAPVPVEGHDHHGRHRGRAPLALDLRGLPQGVGADRRTEGEVRVRAAGRGASRPAVTAASGGRGATEAEWLWNPLDEGDRIDLRGSEPRTDGRSDAAMPAPVRRRRMRRRTRYGEREGDVRSGTGSAKTMPVPARGTRRRTWYGEREGDACSGTANMNADPVRRTRWRIRIPVSVPRPCRRRRIRLDRKEKGRGEGRPSARRMARASAPPPASLT